MRGSIGTDFSIVGEIVLLGPDPTDLRPPTWAPVRFDIEVDDDGQVRLREDRECGVPGPRCVEPTFSCLRPVILLPEGEGD